MHLACHVEGTYEPHYRITTVADVNPPHSRKLKCDKLSPCSNCQKFQRDCVYIAPALDTVAQQKLAHIKDRLGHLEESLGRDVARAPSEGNPDSDDDEDAQEPDDEESLEPTPLAMFDQCYDEDADDELMDLGIQLGKMRFSDRVGGLFRPKMAAEVSNLLSCSTVPRLIFWNCS